MHFRGLGGPDSASVAVVMGYLLDTSAVSRICDGAVPLTPWLPAYIPAVVLSELAADPDRQHRQKLLETVLGKMQILRTEGPAADYGHGITTDEDEGTGFHQRSLSLGRHLPLIARTIGRRFDKHWQDGFVVQAALSHGLTLVTADRKQAQAARLFGAAVKFIKPGRAA